MSHLGFGAGAGYGEDKRANDVGSRGPRSSKLP